MAWTRPKLREICLGMEINGYFAGKLSRFAAAGWNRQTVSDHPGGGQRPHP
jgi:coenzyme PQQ precursor peptide PqqA